MSGWCSGGPVATVTEIPASAYSWSVFELAGYDSLSWSSYVCQRNELSRVHPKIWCNVLVQPVKDGIDGKPQIDQAAQGCLTRCSSGEHDLASRAMIDELQPNQTP